MTDVPADDLRELGPATLPDPDFPRWRGVRPDSDVRFVRSRYRLFKRSRGDGSWVCQCGLARCDRRRFTWEDLSACYSLWLVPVADARRVVRVLRIVGAHFGGDSNPNPDPNQTPAVVSNYSDLTDPQREALLAGLPGARRRVPRLTGDALVGRGLLHDSYAQPGQGWYLLTEAGLRARRALERGEVPDPPGLSGPRVWFAGDPDPAEDGLEVADCEGDVWRRRGGRWFLAEWGSGRPVPRSVSEDGATDWAEVREYAPLTERLHRDPKRARPAEDARPDFREELAGLHDVVSLFFTGRASLLELRAAQRAARRTLDLVPGRSR
jgi:hypothetical protein